MDQVDQEVCLHGAQDLDQWEDLQESGVLLEALEGRDPEVQDLEASVKEEMEVGVAVKKNQKLRRKRKLMKLI